MAEAFQLSFEVPVVTVRPFNTFGPRQSARAVIPTIIGQCLKGETVRLGSVHPTRDMNYVSNTVDGFVMAGTSPGVVGQTINLGSGREISIGDLAHMIADIIGAKISVQTDDVRKRPENSEVERLLADNTQARQLMGWKPQVDLEEGLRRTVEWMRQSLDRYRTDAYVV